MASEKKPVKKPNKPYPDFPLFAHATGRWAKKIRGKLHYFGPWRDPQAALGKYMEQRDDLHAGRTPRLRGDTATVRDLANRFLTWKEGLVTAGDLSPRTFASYHATCQGIVRQFGRGRLLADLVADDFEAFRVTLAATRAPTTLAAEIARVRVVFRFAYDRGLIDNPIRYGGAFQKPSQKLLRQSRNAVPKMFQASELRAILDAADEHMTAFVLLGVNCGFGPADIGTLPRKALDLKAGWVSHPRQKTAIPRRCPLWPQTAQAVRQVLTPTKDTLAFRTCEGNPWTSQGGKHSNITRAFMKLLRRLGLYQKGVGFYTLRRTFETIGGDSRDQVAVDALMGHAPASGDMSAVYRQRVDDTRLIAVTDHVRAWLFADAEDDQGEQPDVVKFIPKTG